MQTRYNDGTYSEPEPFDADKLQTLLKNGKVDSLDIFKATDNKIVLTVIIKKYLPSTSAKCILKIHREVINNEMFLLWWRNNDSSLSSIVYV